MDGSSADADCPVGGTSSAGLEDWGAERTGRGLHTMERAQGALQRRLSSVLAVIREPDLYLMFLRIYLPILFPLTFLIVLLGSVVDSLLGWTTVVPSPYNVLVALLLFICGGALWIYSYTLLIFGGEGSPSPAIRRTQRLVTWGIYARCRNPSVIAKLLGVSAVGLLVNSPSFTYILVPVLLAGSLLEKVWRQEPVLVELFGEEYLAYRRRVPLFIPRIFVPLEERRGPLPSRPLEHLELPASPQAERQ